jgi:hypothetical protein
MAEPLELGLFDNALDSLRHGLHHYREGWNDQRNYKYAFTHVFHAVVLFLKERLSRDHPSLIYDKVEEPSGNTVGYEQAVKRLRNACGVEISQEEETRLAKLRAVRNQVEHFRVTIDQRHAGSIIGGVLPFIRRFLIAELDTDLKEYLDTDDWDTFLEIEEIRDQVYQEVQARLDSYGKERLGMEVFDCPACWLSETCIEDEGPSGEPVFKCLVCNRDFEITGCDWCGARLLGDELGTIWPAGTAPPTRTCDYCDYRLEKMRED